MGAAPQSKMAPSGKIVVALKLLSDATLTIVAFWLTVGTVSSLSSGSLPAAAVDMRLLQGMLATAVSKLVLLASTGSYKEMWRYIDFDRFAKFAVVVCLATAIAGLARQVVGADEMSLRFVTIDLVWTFLLLSVPRVAWRLGLASSVKGPSPGPQRSARRCLVYGAGSAGVLTARFLGVDVTRSYNVIGFVDDDEGKFGQTIVGFPVLGSGDPDNLSLVLKEHAVEVVIVAIGNFAGKRARDVLRVCEQAGVAYEMMPGTFYDAPTHVTPRPAALEDLISRGRHRLMRSEVLPSYTGKTILVSGAGGSIGSEICLQLARSRPKQIILVDISEFNLYSVLIKLREMVGAEVNVVPVLGSARDESRMDQLLRRHRPDFIIHAAAYKHLNIVQFNISEAFVNNLGSTLVLARLAARHGVGAFVLISTDKAVKPSSAMGLSKRLCELAVAALGQQGGGVTKFTAVRFGNVLGSSGSVVPRFLEQIQKGGPVTVTHPEVRRFFMTISEAVSLVLRGSSRAAGGETVILQMGEAIRIYDLAMDLIKASGKKPGVDIDVVFSGLNPGEKLDEELFDRDIEAVASETDDFLTVKHPKLDSAWMLKDLEAVLTAAEIGDDDDCLTMARSLIQAEYLQRHAVHTSPALPAAEQADGRARILLSPPTLNGRESRYVAEAIASGWIAPQGPFAARFEAAVKSACGSAHAVALSSGTAALHLALRLAGVQPGDEVLCSDLTFIASVSHVVHMGAKPVFIDCERVSWNLDPTLLLRELEARAAAGRPQPRALVVTHLFGQCADMAPIVNACERFNVFLIEDAAEALGATYRGRHAGTFGRCGVFSFNGNKIVTTSGGGMLVTDDPMLAERARFLANQAKERLPYYEHREAGFNYTMSNLLAAVGLAQIETLPERIASRRNVYHQYRAGLTDIPGIAFMPEAPHCHSTRWLTCITVDAAVFGCSREDVRLGLEAAGIEARAVWKPMHLQPVFAGSRVVGGLVGRELFETGLCLPSGSHLKAQDIRRIVEAIKSMRVSQRASA